MYKGYCLFRGSRMSLGQKSILLFTILLISDPAVCSSSSRQNCLKNMRIITTTQNSITVGWDYTCQGHDVAYKVYYEHKKWNACGEGQQDQRRGIGRGNTETSNRQIVLPNMHPFSVYRISVKALASDNHVVIVPPEEQSIMGETLEDLPGVAPSSASSVGGGGSTVARKTSLQFSWRNPPRTSCQDFHTELDSTYYVLAGTDLWNQGDEQKGSTSETTKVFEYLRPFANYTLSLYAQDTRGRYNEDISFKIAGRTQPDVPLPPRDLSAATAGRGDRSTRALQWLPPYPPTGTVHFYTLRWREESDDTLRWMGQEEVYESVGQCGPHRGFEQVDVYERPVCRAVGGLDPSRNYTFQVNAKNEGVTQSSPWSREFQFFAKTGNDDEDENDDASIGLDQTIVVLIVVVSLVAVLVVILSASVFAWRRRRTQRKDKYKNVPTYDTAFPTSNRSSIVTSPRSPVGAPPTDPMLKYQHHLLPPPLSSSRQGSIQEMPLPPVPKEEHTYEELRLKPPPPPPPRLTTSKADDDDDDDANSEDEFLQPTSMEMKVLRARTSSGKSLDEEDYLSPRKKKASADTLDMDDYLKPTFNQFQQINTRDLSPPSEAPPPIPKVSYTPVQSNSSKSSGPSFQ